MRNIVFKVVVVCSFLVSGVGCSIAPLSHNALEPHEAMRSGHINIAEKANGLDGSKVGWGRITPFAIPIVPIYIKGDESVDLMSNISEALVLSGYIANTVLAEDESNPSPTLHALVNKKRYSNYTYFAPLVPTWGSMDVTLSLVKPDGETVWEHNFKAGGFTMNFFNGYDIASKKSMTKILNQMVVAFSSDVFYDAINSVELASSKGKTAKDEQGKINSNF